MTTTHTDTPLDRRLRPGEVCAQLGISPTTLRRWVDEGHLTATITLGGHRRYSETEVRKLAESDER